MSTDTAFTLMQLIQLKKPNIPWRKRDSVILLYPINDFLKAKQETFTNENMFYEDSEHSQYEAVIMGVKVIGCPIAKPLFVLPMDGEQHG